MLCGHDASAIAALLGVLKAGSQYRVLDASQTVEWNGRVLAAQLAARLAALADDPAALPVR